MQSQLKIFNTLTGKKEDFKPINPPKVLMYACGPTVYDLSHLGHARMALTFDVIQRYLRFAGYDVTFVRNITDVDDKIINKAKELNVRPEEIALKYTDTFHKDMHDLNAALPDVEPRATEYIEKMLAFTQSLIDAGHAYEAGGDVYFDVLSFKTYGKLKKQSLDEMIQGAREQVRSQSELKELKKNHFDFALWKSVDQKEPGWQSPWGWGRPGWHLECSTMIKNVLGETIDIHGGGEDLVFPHHENEIAQSEALHKKTLANYWIHNSFVQVEAEKMSKSLGNFRTIQSILESYSADTIRFFVLQTHYRSPIEFTEKSMESAKAGISRLIRAAQFAPEANGKATENIDIAPIQKLDQEFRKAMDNDFNTPQAVSALFALADTIFVTTDAITAAKYGDELRRYAAVLGFTLEDTRRTLDPATTAKLKEIVQSLTETNPNTDDAAQLMEMLLSAREQARANKDYKRSDMIRDRLLEVGIKVMDVKGGKATWECS
jgi:cysteinyl-tRNA synthetase